MYWCAAVCCWCAGICAHLCWCGSIPWKEAVLCSAELWLGMGSGSTCSLWGALQLLSVCMITNPREQTSNCANTVCYWRSGTNAVMAERPHVFSKSWTPGFSHLLDVFLLECCLLSLFYTRHLSWNSAHVSIGISMCYLLLITH